MSAGIPEISKLKFQGLFSTTQWFLKTFVFDVVVNICLV